MKLNKVYKSIIIEELLTEDRNQAKAYLIKLGITDNRGKLKQEYVNDKGSFAYNFYETVKILIAKFQEHGMIGDLGPWVKNTYEIITTNEDVNDPDLNFIDDMKALASGLAKLHFVCKKLGVSLLKVYKESGEDTEKAISKIFKDKFIEDYIPDDIMTVFNGNSDRLDDLERILKSAPLEGVSMMKKLEKLHRKFLRFSPVDEDGNKRSDEEVFDLIDFIKSVVKPGEYTSDKNLAIVKNTSNVIWEGPNQLIIKITKEDAIKDKATLDSGDKEIKSKVCHGSNSWCIIYNPKEYWNGNAGDETYVLFTKDNAQPNDRIAIIKKGNSFAYWDNDDRPITTKLKSAVPNSDEIEKVLGKIPDEPQKNDELQPTDNQEG